MRIMLELPDPKFKVGDVVRIENDRLIDVPGYARYYQVHGVDLEYTLRIIDSEYYAIFGPGSCYNGYYVTDTPSPDAWIGDPAPLFIDELDAEGELVTDMAEVI